MVPESEVGGYEGLVMAVDPTVKKVLCVSCKDQNESLVKKQVSTYFELYKFNLKFNILKVNLN